MNDMTKSTHSAKEANMDTTHFTTIEPVGEESRWGDGAYRLVCSVCGHWHTYQGREFSQHEARAHDEFMNRSAK